MIAERTNAEKWTENFYLRALALSLVIHLACFGGWKWGQTRGWWKQSSLPRWMQLVQNNFLTKVAKKIPAQPPQPTPLLFVDVDPTLATIESPKDAKFYGPANSQAATTEQKKESDLPQIEGTQEKVLKTTDNSTKAKPLQPSPPQQQEKPESSQPKSEPKKTETPGDLAFAKPAEKTQKKNGESADEQTPPRKRLTVDQAKAKQGIRGDKMMHNGSANKLAMTSSLNVKRTAIGDYDATLVDAVQQKWDSLILDLLHGDANQPGKVVLEFRLHYDGRITNMKVNESDVGELLSLICQKAILDPAPFDRWPTEMRREIGGDFRDVKFTFYYLSR